MIASLHTRNAAATATTTVQVIFDNHRLQHSVTPTCEYDAADSGLRRRMTRTAMTPRARPGETPILV